MSVRQAVLLVGGRGTRVWPLTASRPKALLPVAGIPFIELQLDQLVSVGVEEVFLAIGTYHVGAWEDYMAARTSGPRVFLSVEHERLDTAGPVVELLDRLDERFLVLNGDVLLDTDLSGFIASSPPGALGTLALVDVEDPSAYGVVVRRPDGIIDRFVEKPLPGTEPAMTVSAGIYTLTRDALSRWDRGALSFERVVFPALVGESRLGASLVDGHWLDIGTAGLYLSTHDDVFGGATSVAHPGPSHHVAATADMLGVFDGDWAWVGEGCRVGEAAVIEESILLPGAVIGTGATIRRAIIGWGATVGDGATVTGEAMVGEGAVIGAECELDAGALIAPGAVLAPGSVTFSPPQ